MKLLTIAAMFIAAFAVILASPTDAKNQAAKGKAKEVMEERAQEVAERAETKRDRLPKHDELTRKRGKGADDDESPDDDESGNGRDDATGQGNEKAQEMRARRDERKAIMEEYKAESKSRNGGVDADSDALDRDVEEESKSTEKKEKKAWWKFWE